jgi:CHAT domain-containing protein/predicted negative regulator of RcsB-dependent stress response
MVNPKQFLSHKHQRLLALTLTTLLALTAPAIAHQSNLSSSTSSTSFTSSAAPATSATALDQGRNLYSSGQFAEAAAIWQQAAKDYERQGDRLSQAWSLSYLALAYQEMGQLEDAKQAIAQSLELLNNTNNPRILAQALNTQGQIQNTTGQTEAALESWKQAETAYRSANDTVGTLGSRINQAQALQNLGFYRRAYDLLKALNTELVPEPNSAFKAKALRNLGTALQAMGNLKEAQTTLQQSLEVAQALNDPTETSETLLSLGNVARELRDPEGSLNFYRQAATTTQLRTQVEAHLNQLSLLVELNQQREAIALIESIQPQLTALPTSRSTIYAAVNFSRSLAKLAAQQPNFYRQAAEVAAQAKQQAVTLGDRRAEAYAATQLGMVYEQTQQWSEASVLTQKGLNLAQDLNAADIASRSAWQMGRILNHQGKTEEAIAAYRTAVSNLKSLRSDLAAVNTDVQFSFTEAVEPVYRELVGLLLEETDPSQDKLKEARQLIESLQLAELDNYFRESCLNAQPQQIDQVDQKAAVIYPIILGDRLEVILSMPGEPLRHYATRADQRQINETLVEMRSSLNLAYSNQERMKRYQQVYDWLVRPAEADLTHKQIKTLVFVLDGSLRNLPMAALHDGKQYLVENYRVALNPGLQLLSPRSLAANEVKALTAGLSEARQGFRALPGVATEIQDIANTIRSRSILNQDFTQANLENSLSASRYPILHLATHGQFSSNAEETFILTWDERINVKEFDELLKTSERGDRKTPIELLILSACQTAQGDNRAVLGLAGLAVRSGARSTLATLWAVRDESTAKFMAEFYKQLSQPGMEKAEAMRQAQLVLLKSSDFQHPYYWAPFVLVGNWL